MDNENLIEKAVNEFKPNIEEQYKSLIHRTFDQIVEAHGPTLKGAYNSWKFARVFSETISRLLKPTKSNVLHAKFADAEPRELDEAKIEKAAKAYAEAVAEGMLMKIKEKLGDMDAPVVKQMNASTFLITGNKKEIPVSIEQTVILNFSKNGKMFHQFPARIYVNGKFTSAAKFKKL